MQTNGRVENWYDDETSTEEIDYPVHEYDITASPNDFNIQTLYNFVDRGTINIPRFQRNYVWDLKRASKLIESLIIGLPIPQIFLYEEGRNKFSVIDGQQRLMSIYYFVRGRFPRLDKRPELRRMFEGQGKISDEVLENDNFFTKFNLDLPTQIPNQKNKFHGINYATLGDYQSSFDLKTIRSIIVKQITPIDDDSSIYEIFHRLNSGGVNLRPQEIRASLYHSEFYNMLYRVNTDPRWRRFLENPTPDLYMKDVEFVLRGFAMLNYLNKYGSSMAKFLNDYSRKAKSYNDSDINYFEHLFSSFLDSCMNLPDNAFLGTTQRFSITIYESIFVAVCSPLLENRTFVYGRITETSVNQLKSDPDFLGASERATASKNNVTQRLTRAASIIQIA